MKYSVFAIGKRILNRIWPRKKIIFLDWYKWVNAPFREIFRKNISLRLEFRTLHFNKSYVESLVNSSKILKCFWKRNEIKDYKFLTYDNLNLWELSKSSIFVKLTRCTIELEDDFKEIKDCFSRAIHFIECFKKLYNIEKPYAILVEQGLQYDSRVAVEVARRLRIKTVAIENSFIKDLIFIDNLTGAICNRHTLSRVAWDRIKARELSEEQIGKLKELWNNYTTQIPQASRDNLETIRNKLKIDPNKKIALLIGQVITDGVMAMDSYIYKDSIDFIKDTIKLFRQHSEYHLIIRLHPKESYGADWIGRPYNNIALKRLKKLKLDQEKNVSIVHSLEVNTYSLMEIASFAITINSQAGLEMLAKYKPVIVLGDAFYAKKGFTYDVNYRETYPVVLKKIIDNPILSKRQRMDIDKFLYYMIFEYLFPSNLEGCGKKMEKMFN